MTPNLPTRPGSAHSRRVRFLVWVGLCIVACGGENLPPPSVASESPASSRPLRPPRGALWREDVDAVVNAGLGRFLQFVTVEARLDGEEFVGWQVVDVRPAETWEDVDLRPGDVVTRVNGKPLEREGDAYAAFVSLKRADRLSVTYLRGDEQRELVWRIVAKSGLRGNAVPSRDGRGDGGAVRPLPSPSGSSLGSRSAAPAATASVRR